MDQLERERKLEEAMDLYGDYIVQLCYTYVRSWQTAEDLAQETFLRYFEALPKFRGDASIKTFLFRIAVNISHNYITSWKYKKIHITTFFQKLLMSADTPESQLLKKTESQQLVAAIEELPTKYKDVIVLFHFAELPLQEVGRALKLPVNTVKTRLRRARQMLGMELMEGGELHGSN
ncbi:sigma-70 family RNA polymerase sigma factor [Solibacillus silvestris]|uniref:sigma-70 family RNA polymerase sigma factor n=1 Tax=Solibacillus silvestris TaxID=76853 RepID=UPI003F80A625